MVYIDVLIVCRVAEDLERSILAEVTIPDKYILVKYVAWPNKLKIF